MNLEKIREYCLSLPHVTEEVLWEKDLVFKIGGKMFAVIGLDAGPASNSRSNARRKSSPN
jgi:predicted DNA-binding protein (MmcQ/YjbR family)